jgi:putative transposase
MFIGRSIQPGINKNIVLNAQLMAARRRNPKQQVMVHSDQASQYSSYDWQAFPKDHDPEGGRNRQGNFLDNAAAGSFFQLLKRERIRESFIRTGASSLDKT